VPFSRLRRRSIGEPGATTGGTKLATKLPSLPRDFTDTGEPGGATTKLAACSTLRGLTAGDMGGGTKLPALKLPAVKLGAVKLPAFSKPRGLTVGEPGVGTKLGALSRLRGLT